MVMNVIHDLFDGCFICSLYYLMYLKIVERTVVLPKSIRAAFIHVIPWPIPNIFCGYNVDKEYIELQGQER